MELYENNLRDTVERGPAPMREQIVIAMDAIPDDPDRLDAWFREHIQKPPLSHDTALYNRLQKAKEELKDLLAPGTGESRDLLSGKNNARK